MKKIFEKFNKAILAAGALAVAISAIVLLVNQLAPPPPPPPPKASASFARIDAPREVTLAEYEADGGSLSAAYHPAGGPREGTGYRLAADVVAPPGRPSVSSRPNLSSGSNVTIRSSTAAPGVDTTTTPTTSTTPRETTVHTQDTTLHIFTSTSTTSTTTTTTTTTGPSPPSTGSGETYDLRSGRLPSNSYRVHNAIIQEGNGTPPEEVSEMLADRRSEQREEETHTISMTSSPSQSGTGTYSQTTSQPESEPPVGGHSVALPKECTRCALLPILESALADSKDNAAAAARELRAAEREWRRRNRNGRPQLVGVEVDYRLDLKGLEGKKVIVKYTIYEAGRNLSEEWWGLRVADKGTVPKDSPASVPEKLWALIPQAPGTYYLHLELYSGERELEDADTPKFH